MAGRSCLKSLRTGLDIYGIKAITRNILKLFCVYKDTLFTLERIKEALKVDKRRIYDVINVLSALRLVKKVAKGQYKWNPIEKAQRHIAELQSRSSYSKISPACLSELALQFLSLFPPGTRVPSERVPELLLLANIDSSGLKTKRITNLLKIFLAVGLAEFVPSRNLTVNMVDTSNMPRVMEQIGRATINSRVNREVRVETRIDDCQPALAKKSNENDILKLQAPVSLTIYDNFRILERYLASGSIILPKVRVPRASYLNNG